MNKKTAIISLIGTLVLAAIVAFISLPPGTGASEVPKTVGQMTNFQLAPSTRSPDISWKDAGGREVSLNDFEGKVVLFNYWASWCAPCQRELPGINRLQARLGGDNFTVVAINIDQGGKTVAMRQARRLKLDNLKLYLDPTAQTARVLGLRTMPTTFVFDRQGRELGKMEGGVEWDVPEAIALLQYFIDRPDYADRSKTLGD